MRFNAWTLAPMLVVVGVLLTVRYRSEVPSRADWSAATEHVKAHVQSGDGVTWAPYWAGEGRLFLSGLPAFHLVDSPTADLSRYKRVWLLGAFGSSSDDLNGPYARTERTEFGGVTVDLVENRGERVLSDLRRGLKSARVSLGAGEGTLCDFWDGRGWHCKTKLGVPRTVNCLNESTSKRLNRHRRRRQPNCGLDRWLHVSRDVRVIGDLPRRCIWLHPRKGKETRVSWDAPAGGDRVVVDYGFTDKVITDHTRKSSRTQPARLTLFQDGESIGSHTVTPEKGWRSWSVNLSNKAKGRLALEVTTESTVDAHLCVDVTLRGEATQ